MQESGLIKEIESSSVRPVDLIVAGIDDHFDRVIVNGLPITIHGQGIFSSGSRIFSVDTVQEDGRVIPEATDTIVCAIQSGGISPPVWWSSIIGPVIGGILATVAGFILAGWRENNEKKQRRERIASALMVDVMMTHLIFTDIPHLDKVATQKAREATQKAIWRLIKKNLGPIELYPRNGLFATCYADIATLGPMATLQIVSLYIFLEDVERLITRIRDNPEERVEILEAEGPDSIYYLIYRVNICIEGVEELLRPIIAQIQGKE